MVVLQPSSAPAKSRSAPSWLPWQETKTLLTVSNSCYRPLVFAAPQVMMDEPRQANRTTNQATGESPPPKGEAKPKPFPFSLQPLCHAAEGFPGESDSDDSHTGPSPTWLHPPC